MTPGCTTAQYLPVSMSLSANPVEEITLLLAPHAPSGVGDSMTTLTSRATTLEMHGLPIATAASQCVATIPSARLTRGPTGTANAISSLEHPRLIPMDKSTRLSFAKFMQNN
jgi:hypothetical protein